MASYYNWGVSSCQFFLGEKVWRKTEFTHQYRMNKLSPMWVGPYKVVDIPIPTHVLEDDEENRLKNTFNAEHKFHA